MARGSSNNHSDWIELRGGNLAFKLVRNDEKENTFQRKNGSKTLVEKGDAVLVTIVGRKTTATSYKSCNFDDDGPVFQKTDDDWLVKVGDADLLVPALQLTLSAALLEAGQTALVYSKPQYALQSGTRNYKEKKTSKKKAYTLPADSTVVYELTVKEIVPDTSRLDPAFSIHEARTKKMIANDLFLNEGAVVRARCLRLYQRLATDMKLLLDGPHFVKDSSDSTATAATAEAKQLMLDGWNNSAAVHVTAKDWTRARHAITEVLKEDPTNLKALVRQAKVATMDERGTSLDEWDEALKQAEQVVTLKDKEEADLRKWRAEWKQKKRAGRR